MGIGFHHKPPIWPSKVISKQGGYRPPLPPRTAEPKPPILGRIKSVSIPRIEINVVIRSS